MIINNVVVSYFVMMLFSLGICFPAAYVGWQVVRDWRPGHASNEQQKLLENKVYLVIAFTTLGFTMRLFMIPLWFLTLQSLIPSVPGAMCMAGLHQLDAPVSCWATVLKFFIPLVYIFWLVLNAVDRRIESQPFMRRKLRLVLVLAVLMAVESFLDAHFLSSIKPKIVSCCTFMFDLPRSVPLKLIRHEGLLWVVSFYVCVGTTLIAHAARFVWGKTFRVVSVISASLALLFFVLTLHTRIAPLMLEAPYHQCIFCLWQGFADIAIASAFVITGLWLTLVCAAIPDLRKHFQADKFLARINAFAVMLLATGVLWVTLRFIFKYFSSTVRG